jgi:hypothetical protein
MAEYACPRGGWDGTFRQWLREQSSACVALGGSEAELAFVRKHFDGRRCGCAVLGELTGDQI